MIKKLSGATGCILFLLAGTAGYSQQLNGTTTDAGLNSGASADGQGGLFNPNLYDGSANINIPIYHFETETGNFGVSLAYNTKGMQVRETASPLGLHWSLFAGGGVFRLVKDLPDEINLPVPDPFGYIEYNRLKGRLAASFETSPLPTGVYRDKESDDFTVSIGGSSFTFNIGMQRALFTHPDRRIKVSFLYNDVPVEDMSAYPDMLNTGVLPGLFLSDETGNKYYFTSAGTEYRRIESEYPWVLHGVDIEDYALPTGWVISKVVLAGGGVIQYTYNGISVPGNMLFGGYSSPEINGSVSVGPTQNVSAYGDKQLSSISYPNGTKVEFLYGSTRCDYAGGALREIRVSEGGNQRRYMMDQAYFVSKTVNNTITERAYDDPCMSIQYTPYGSSTTAIYDQDDVHRLKLKGIHMLSKDGTVSEPFYTFGYSDVAVPRRKGGGQDYFGYYNGKAATRTGIYAYSGFTPDVSVPYRTISAGSGFGLDKTPDINFMKAGILTKVTNAYGGTIELEYGVHPNLGNISNGPVLPTDPLFLGTTANDGLCLLSMTEKDAYHPGSYRKTSYLYEQGQRFMPGGYFHYNTRMADAISDNYLWRVFQDVYVSRHQLINGSNHGYSKVTATVKNESGQQLSKRISTFTNLSDATSGNLPRFLLNGGSSRYFEFPFTDKQYLKSWEMGLPLTVTDYDDLNLIRQKTEYKYDFQTDITGGLTKKVGGIRSAKMSYAGAPVIANWPNWDNMGVGELRTFNDTYVPYTGHANLQWAATSRYTSNSAFMADTAWYSYDGRNNLRETVVSLSDGSKTATRRVYNYDAPVQAGSTPTLMTDAGIEKVVSTERWLETPGGGAASRRLQQADISGYRYQGGKLWIERLYTQRTNEPVPAASYNTAIPGQQLQSAFAGQPVAYLEKASEVQLYDSRGNPLQSWLAQQDMYKATLWDTTTGRKRAEVLNARYSDIAYSSFDITETQGGSVLVTHGNLHYNLGQVDAPSIAGINSYKLGPVSFYAPITGSQKLTAGKEYIVSFWAKDGIPEVTVSGNLIPVTEAVYSNGTWSNYQVRFTPATAGSLRIGKPATGTVYVDEVRLFPADAGMESWTYQPLYGISSGTGADGRITYYEYDAFGRAVIVRDQEGNVVSKTRQVVQGAQ